MIADKILPLLEKVKETGAGRWLACCPAHEDRHPSLAIREVDGALLLHCFTGCEVAEIVSAIGLELSDLFPELESKYGKPLSRPFPAADILKSLANESIYLMLCAEDLSKGKQVDKQRLSISAGRFRSALKAGGLE